MPAPPRKDAEEAIAAAKAALSGLVALHAAGALRDPEEGLRRDPRPQGRTRPPAVARGGQDAGRGHRRGRRAPARSSRFFAGEALRLAGEKLASMRPGVDVEITREPVGVVGMITPWNFPIAIPAWKIAPALAYGNTRGVQAGRPRARLRLGAGRHHRTAPACPRACFNLVMGRGSEVGAALLDHPDVARHLLHRLGRDRPQGGAGLRRRLAPMKKVQLEMGGKNPLVVLDDADLEDGGRMRGQRRLLLDRPALHGLLAPDRHRRASTTASSRR